MCRDTGLHGVSTKCAHRSSGLPQPTNQQAHRLQELYCEPEYEVRVDLLTNIAGTECLHPSSDKVNTSWKSDGRLWGQSCA